MKGFDRYKSFRDNGNVKCVPFVSIPLKNTDFYTYYEVGKTRLDLLSYQYYDDPNYGWLILQANPQWGSLEFKIPNGAKLRIPYPLSSVLLQYQNDCEKYIRLYGLNEI